MYLHYIIWQFITVHVACWPSVCPYTDKSSKYHNDKQSSKTATIMINRASKTSTQLARLDKPWCVKREAAGSNPSRTNI